MKKRLGALLLAAALTISLLVLPAQAAPAARFSDVTDQNTAVAVEVLRMMGVLDGYGDGTFRPQGQLTRAQFCKMAAYAMDGAGELGRYRTVTIFPDVKPSHWAASFINMAAKGKGIIAGYPDGKFYPDRTVTAGHAVTILLRLLGYTDEEVGGVWPDSYMAVGESIGLTEGVGAGGSTPLTRAQAAKLFLNLLDTEKKGGGTLYTLGGETELLSVDGGSGIMKTADGKTYHMVRPTAATGLTGARGRVVLNKDGKALTFLPDSIGSVATVSGGVVIVAADRSAAGFAELAGNNQYTIYKNGIQIGMGGLRKNDVATFYPATNSIRVCDTRVTVYYESCMPSPDAPVTITALGGTEFTVLPAARASLAKFKPGRQVTLLLTADGQVASAVEASGTSARGNAVGLVGADGSVDLLCGSDRLPLGAKAPAEYYGKVVSVSSSKKDALNLSVLSGGASGDLNVDTRKVGSRDLAENVIIIDGGRQVSLSAITSGIVRDELVNYARINWNDDVDLVVLNSGSENIIYGRAKVSSAADTQIPIKDSNGKEPDDPSWIPTYETIAGDTTLTVEYGNGKSISKVNSYAARTGDYVAITVRNDQFVNFVKLTELEKVSPQSWLGTASVLHGGKSYPVPSDVLCYNADGGSWITLEQAMAYSGTMNLYVHDGVVRIVEVSR